MADYKRVVSYIYLYNHQLKGSNIGFARMETRNNQCKFTIHVRIPSMAEQAVKAYIYCWYDNTMHGVLLGDVHIRNGTGDFSLVTDAENLCNSEYALSEMSGIIFYISDTQFLGTEWDDHPIVFDTLKIDDKKPSELKKLRAEPERSNKQPVSNRGESRVQDLARQNLKAEERGKREGEDRDPEIVPMWRQDSTWQQICEDQQSRMRKGKEARFVLPSKEIEESLEGNFLHAAELQGANEKPEELEEEIRDTEKEKEDADEAGEMNEEQTQADLTAQVERQAMDGEPAEVEAFERKDQEEEAKIENTFPLDQERMHSLDQQAQELFGNMLQNSMFKPQEPEKKVDVAEASPSVVVSPKSAIECFTAFKSCESQEEYEEIQDEIKTLQSQIAHLERISEEWLIKLARIEEERETRAREKEILEAKLRESFNIDMDIFAEEEAEKEDGLSQQSILEEAAPSVLKVSAVVSRIFAKYPKIEPFAKDSDVEECVRIEPQDIGIFPMENWILANNSFLLHGYYSYRHLIFAMCNNDGTAEFFLGVPGIYHRCETFMAKMFGFNHFKPIEQEPAEEESAERERFGYWCMPIRMPV